MTKATTKDLKEEMYFEKNSITTLSEIKELANLLLNENWFIDIYRFQYGKTFNLSDKGWKFEFNDRKRAAGLCSLREKIIYISEWLLNQNLNKSREFENTLRHELAHAIDFEMRGKSDHSDIWKAIAKKVLCTAERCFTHDQIGITEKTKYTLVCDICKKETPSHKVKKKQSACGKCCKEHNFGRYSDKYVLRQVQNF